MGYSSFNILFSKDCIVSASCSRRLAKKDVMRRDGFIRPIIYDPVSRTAAKRKNIIEFMPKKEGVVTMNCWMNMLNNSIKVVDDYNYFEVRK